MSTSHPPSTKRLTPRLAIEELREAADQYGFNSREYEAAVARYSERMRAALVGKRIERAGAQRTSEHYVVDETPARQGEDRLPSS